jgi:hypothetical protein
VKPGITSRGKTVDAEIRAARLTVPNTTVLESGYLLKKRCPREGTAMIPYDIFRIESNGVLWCDAVTTVETAKDCIENSLIRRLVPT